MACLGVDLLHFFALGLTDAYYNSWAYIIKPQWPDRHYTYFSNIHTTGLAVFAALTGLALYFTRRYKWVQLLGVIIRTVGEGVNYYGCTRNNSDGVLIAAKIMISMGAGMIVTTTAVAAPASVPHADLACAMAILHMVGQLAGSVAGSISASVWNTRVPANLAKYLPDTDAKTRAAIFGSIRRARRTEPHDLVVRAYSEGIQPLLAAAIGVSACAIIVTMFTQEIKLGKSHNAVETHKEIRLLNKQEASDEAIKERVQAAEARARVEMCPMKAM